MNEPLVGQRFLIVNAEGNDGHRRVLLHSTLEVTKQEGDTVTLMVVASPHPELVGQRDYGAGITGISPPYAVRIYSIR